MKKGMSIDQGRQGQNEAYFFNRIYGDGKDYDFQSIAGNTFMRCDRYGSGDLTDGKNVDPGDFCTERRNLG